MSKFDDWRKKIEETNNSKPKCLYLYDKDEYPTEVFQRGVINIKRADWSPSEILLLRDWITENFDN